MTAAIVARPVAPGVVYETSLRLAGAAGGTESTSKRTRANAKPGPRPREARPKKRPIRLTWSDGTVIVYEGGAATTLQVPRDKPRKYLNAEAPIRHFHQPLSRAICTRCGHGYTALVVDPSRAECPECRLQRIAALAAALRAAGIELGWGKPPAERGPIDDLAWARSVYHSQHPDGLSGVRLRALGEGHARV